jgi:hypothetical protein
LWNASAKDSTELIAVQFPQEGPVLSCQWVPDPNKPLSFVVIAGKIPPMASTHNGVTVAVTFLHGNNVHPEYSYIFTTWTLCLFGWIWQYARWDGLLGYE